MKVLIVEDEPIASEKLAKQISNSQPETEIAHIFDTVEDTVDFFKNGNTVDLAFFDIQLSDGNSFEVFQQTEVSNPVVFTTAYDEYTLQAFKVNSIDYLLKPIEDSELQRAFIQYNKLQNHQPQNQALLNKIYQQLNPSYKQRLLLKLGDNYYSKATRDIAFFYAEGKTTYIYIAGENKPYVVDHSLDTLERDILNPQYFFRINRKFVINIEAIRNIKSYANGRLKVMTSPPSPVDMIVSRERVTNFKVWLNQ